jgi:branched-chain amino acid transport system permease protein
LQEATGGRLDAAILRQLLIALAMIGVMLSRPRGIWPPPEHGKAAPAPADTAKSTATVTKERTA